MSNPEETLFTFPCSFPIKAMGYASAELELTIQEIVRNHAPDTSDEAFSKRYSANGKYLSITATIEATSRAQLDAIYLALSANKDILMSL